MQVEVKPYVLDDQLCDECQGAKCGGKFAPFFCANVTCLQYYCEHCWAQIHSHVGREYHKPLVKEGADRPRAIPFRWGQGGGAGFSQASWARDTICIYYCCSARSLLSYDVVLFGWWILSDRMRAHL